MSASEPTPPSASAPDNNPAPPEPARATTVRLRCKKCRAPLATFLPPDSHPQTPSCTAHFLPAPPPWLDASGDAGRLDCPRCRAKLGNWSWSGDRCGCGGWVSPWFGVGRGRVDAEAGEQGGGGE
ncbi:hypothetical protein DFJ74DRAFT_702397 [Hyaloraphidium curvatum]|nr:hypothetical protein DFJ74DRAFT_702397 [Hyaloraphidium curvatum]